MHEVKLIYLYSVLDPCKRFLACDLTEVSDFTDPLKIFSLPDYDPHNINKQGVFALGGDLSVDMLVKSYKFGIFPWFPYKETDEVYWYCPRERYVIFPEKIHISHSLRNLLNKNKYSITVNQSFREVIHHCRMVNGRDNHGQAWLSETIEDIFIKLYELGYAKSIEVWEDNELVGGFYGFWYKGVFQGESMFSLRPSTSQIGLILLCRSKYIEGEKIKLIDTQFETPTFKRLRGEYITYNQYRDIMKNREEG